MSSLPTKIKKFYLPGYYTVIATLLYGLVLLCPFRLRNEYQQKISNKLIFEKSRAHQLNFFYDYKLDLQAPCLFEITVILIASRT